eukprot:757269-Hanusia_phi.AAC.10
MRVARREGKTIGRIEPIEQRFRGSNERRTCDIKTLRQRYSECAVPAARCWKFLLKFANAWQPVTAARLTPDSTRGGAARGCPAAWTARRACPAAVRRPAAQPGGRNGRARAPGPSP